MVVNESTATEWLNNGEKRYEDLNQRNSFNLKNMSEKTVAVVFP